MLEIQFLNRPSVGDLGVWKAMSTDSDLKKVFFDFGWVLFICFMFFCYSCFAPAVTNCAKEYRDERRRAIVETDANIIGVRNTSGGNMVSVPPRDTQDIPIVSVDRMERGSEEEEEKDDDDNDDDDKENENGGDDNDINNHNHNVEEEKLAEAVMWRTV